MTTGTITRGMNDPEYRALEGHNFSSIKHLSTSPLAYRDALDAPRSDTPAMLLGRAIHCAVLEWGTFASRYVVRPEGIDRRTKEGRAAWDAFIAEAGGREVIDVDIAATVSSVHGAVMRHPAARLQLASGEAEVVMQWTDEETGMACKARADWIGEGFLLDLKTTSRLARHAWPSEVARRLYHVQLAFYCDGARACGLGDLEPLILAAETARPYDVGLFTLDEDSIHCGRVTYRDWLLKLSHCEQHGRWFGQYPGSAETLHLPAWAYGEDDEPAEVG